MTATNYSLASLEQPLVTQRVYVRRDGALSFTGDEDGWELDVTLRCEQVSWDWLGSAVFTVVDEDRPAIEQMLLRYPIDTQVKVVIDTPDDELLADQDNEDDGGQAGTCVFEGVLARPQFEVKPKGERVTITALSFAAIDNLVDHHIITGRWVPEGNCYGADDSLASTDPVVMESPELPAVFNWRGHPNTTPVSGSVATALNRYVDQIALDVFYEGFTFEGDSSAELWTVRSALLALAMMWLYSGGADATLGDQRFTALEADTLTALRTVPTGSDSRTAQFRGLDEPLPEISVQGLGVLDAMRAVARAGGFHLFAQPETDPVAAVAAGRKPYLLKLRRYHSGDLTHLDLAKRITPAGSNAFTTSEQFTAANNVNELAGLFDATAIRNSIHGRGRVLIEGRFPLRPLWSPDDVSAATISQAMQTIDDTALAGTGYVARHVAGGALFDQYAHVGRAWGLMHLPRADWIGALTAYTDALYGQEVYGFDFPDHLGLNTANEGAAYEREAWGVTDPMVWMRRPRQVLPLQNPEAVANDLKHWLECSEDGGSTWYPCPIRIQVIPGVFGIYLAVKNLAAINLASLRKNGETPTPTNSWWKMIADKDLTFRITCCIEADHACRYDATRQASSGTVYSFGQLMNTNHVQTWVSPGTIGNSGSDWISLHNGTSGGNLVSDSYEALIGETDRRRDALEDRRISLRAGTPVMRFDRYKLGDRVWGIRGRNLNLGTNNGADERYPTIIAMTLNLGARGQGITLHYDDMAMTKGGGR